MSKEKETFLGLDEMSTLNIKVKSHRGVCILWMLLVLVLFKIDHDLLTCSCNIFTPPRSRGGVIFLLQFVCLCVCVCVSVCEQNPYRTATLILTRSSLNSCLLLSLKPYLNWWPWVKGQGHRHLGHWMRFIELYLGTKYEVIGWNSIRDMVHWLVFRHYWKIWPWPLTLTFVKVTVFWIIKCTLLGCDLVPSMKSVGEITSEIWPIV